MIALGIYIGISATLGVTRACIGVLADEGASAFLGGALLAVFWPIAVPCLPFWLRKRGRA